MKWIALALLAVTMAASAQQTPQSEDITVDQPKTVAELKLENAQLKAQIHELQLQVQLYEAATGTTQRRQADQKAIQAAHAEVEAAEKAKRK